MTGSRVRLKPHHTRDNEKLVPIAAKSVTNIKIMKNVLAHKQATSAQRGEDSRTFYENIHSCFYKEYTL